MPVPLCQWPPNLPVPENATGTASECGRSGPLGGAPGGRCQCQRPRPVLGVAACRPGGRARSPYLSKSTDTYARKRAETRGGMSEADTPHERIADDADASDDAKEPADDAEPMDDDAVADEKGKPRGTACSD